jgi:hypothetical protein
MNKLFFFWFVFFKTVGFCSSPPSLHVLLTTIGRPSIINMLYVLSEELHSRDYLTIVFDAKDEGGVFEQVKNYVRAFPCHCSVIFEPINLGFWGHGIHNKYNVLPGDFIMHADDDDIYLPGSFETIRSTCTNKNTLYIFKIIRINGSTISGNPIIHGNISTQSGMIPRRYNSRSTWGYYYGGDFNFYPKRHEKTRSFKAEMNRARLEETFAVRYIV